jgi:hypothetical protein
MAGNNDLLSSTDDQKKDALSNTQQSRALFISKANQIAKERRNSIEFIYYFPYKNIR